MRADTVALLIGGLMLLGAIVFVFGAASSSEPAPRTAEPVVEVACRGGYAVPLGNYYQVSVSNGIACAVQYRERTRTGPIVCWNLHGCEK